MKIIEVVFTFPPQVFIARHIVAMHLNNINPVLMAFEDNSGDSHTAASFLEENMDLGKLYVPFPTNKSVQKYASLRYLLRPHTHFDGTIRDKILSSFFESQKPDLIHFHFGNLAGYYYAIPQALNIPYTISLRGSDVQVEPYKSKIIFSQIKKAIEGAAGIHTVSDELWQNTLQTFDLSAEKIYHKTIYTTVPMDQNNHVIKKNQKKTFVAVGRFQWRKSFPFLLIAFKNFLVRYPDSELIIIGDGEARESINYWIRYLDLGNQVKLKGKMNYSGIAEIISNADAFIQSSIAEGISNSTAEAMALGCPVFATRVGGTNEIVEDGVTGFLLDPASPESWWEKFQLVNDDNLMKTISDNAFEFAQARFSYSHHADEFTRFYKNAKDKQNPPS